MSFKELYLFSQWNFLVSLPLESMRKCPNGDRFRMLTCRATHIIPARLLLLRKFNNPIRQWYFLLCILGSIYFVIQYFTDDVRFVNNYSIIKQNQNSCYFYYLMLFTRLMPLASGGLALYLFTSERRGPKHLKIGLTGVSLCLTVSSVALVLWKESVWVSEAFALLQWSSHSRHLQFCCSLHSSAIRSSSQPMHVLERYNPSQILLM